MEGIQGLRRQTAVPVQRTISQGAAAKQTAASARTDTFQSVLTEEERAVQAAKTPDLPNFSKMTDRQKLAAQACVLQELKLCGLGDQDQIDETLADMRAKLVQWVKKSRTYAGKEADNATQEEEIAALAMGRQPRQLQKSTDWGALKRALEETADDWDQKIANGYSRQVQSVIDSLVDEIVKGEVPDASDKPAKEPAAGTAPE